MVRILSAIDVAKFKSRHFKCSQNENAIRLQATATVIAVAVVAGMAVRLRLNAICTPFNLLAKWNVNNVRRQPRIVCTIS